jgi:uncharacterized protein
MAGKFRALPGRCGQVQVPAQGWHGEIIAVGEAYESKASALNGIDSVRRNAADATLDDQTR